MNIKDFLHETVENLATTLPSVVIHLQDVLSDEDASFEDIAQVFSNDPSLAIRLLEKVNTPFFGISEKIESIPHALSIIGKEELNFLVLTTELIGKFEGIPEGLISVKDLWEHNLACGVIAREIGSLRGEQMLELFYMGGMLHDFGRLIILNQFPKESLEIFSRAKSEQVPLSQLEREILGYDHAELCGILINSWHLPEILVEAIKFHHEPLEDKGNPILPSTIYLADHIAVKLEMGFSGEPIEPPIIPEVLELLEIKEDFWVPMKEKIFKQFDEAIQTFY